MPLAALLRLRDAGIMTRYAGSTKPTTILFTTVKILVADDLPLRSTVTLKVGRSMPAPGLFRAADKYTDAGSDRSQRDRYHGARSSTAPRRCALSLAGIGVDNVDGPPSLAPGRSMNAWCQQHQRRRAGCFILNRPPRCWRSTPRWKRWAATGNSFSQEGDGAGLRAWSRSNNRSPGYMVAFAWITVLRSSTLCHRRRSRRRNTV